MGDHHEGRDRGHGGFRIGERGPDHQPGPHGDKMGPLREAIIDLGIATKQLAHNGTDDQKAQALEILVDARKRFYSMLAS